MQQKKTISIKGIGNLLNWLLFKLMDSSLMLMHYLGKTLQGLSFNKYVFIFFQPQIKIRDASVTVRPDWSTIEEMDFPRLLKLSLPGIKDGKIYFCD